MESTSPRFVLNWIDRNKIIKGLLIAIGGAALTYFAEQLPMVDFGKYQLIVFPLASSLVNAGIKWLSDYSHRY
jgi:hypothetical protein